MIRTGDLTPRQRRTGRSAVRYLELRGAYLLNLALLLFLGAFFAFLAQRRLARDPADALQLAGLAGVLVAGAGSTLLHSPVVGLLGLLYRELEASGPPASASPPAPVAPAREDLASAERRLVESALQLERLGWGSVRGGLLAVLVSGIAVIAAALWRFGSGSAGLGTAALAMAAAGGLTVGTALGGLAVTRWMRFAARLGAPSRERVSPS